MLNHMFSYAPIAQLDRVTGYEPVGRGFESLSAHPKKASVSATEAFFVCAMCLRHIGLFDDDIGEIPFAE